MQKMLLIIFALLTLSPYVFAQTTYLNWSVLAGGGGHFAGDTINIDATLGQPVIGKMTGSDYILYAGFWVPGGCFYKPGDVNGNSLTDGVDVVYAVNYLKGQGPPPPVICDCVVTEYPFYGGADANGDCHFNGLDVVYLVNYFKGMGPAPHPCPDCPPGGLLPKNALGENEPSLGD
jgi:hypothetical protein